MENILIDLYMKSKITDDEVKEFNEWFSEIATCTVCGTKMMHDDEAYDDENGLGALCDKHSEFNESTSNYRAVKQEDLVNEMVLLKEQIGAHKENGEYDLMYKKQNTLRNINGFYYKIII